MHDIAKSTSLAEHQVDLIEWVFVDICNVSLDFFSGIFYVFCT